MFILDSNIYIVGATVITKNFDDFTLIARALDVRFAPPWPHFTE
jgi:hypothetical protein